MKQIVIPGMKLALICAVAAVSLSLINLATQPRIEAYREQMILQALQEVSGPYEVGQEHDKEYDAVSFVYDLMKDGEVVGYIIRIQADGYGGPMQIIAGYLSDGKLLDARLMENAETPGLGKQAEDPEYMEMFAGKGADIPIPQRVGQLDSADADAVTGSTITFIGIARALQKGSEFVQHLGR